MARRKSTPRRRTRRRHRADEFMTGAEARRFMDAWAAEQNEIVHAKQNIRNLIADFRQYVEDAGVDFDEPAVRPMMEQYLRHAKWGLSKTLSGMARAGRPEVAPDEVLAAFDCKRSSFPSRTATATNVAKHETFIVQHQRRRTRPVGSKVHVSRNLILGLVAQRDGKESRPAKTR